MDYIKDVEKLTASTSTWKPCYHQKGRWFTVQFWWLKRKFLICEDWCGGLVSEKEVKHALKIFKMLKENNND